MFFGSKFVYTAENDADEVEEVEEEEDETIEDVRRRHQNSRDDGQVRKSTEKLAFANGNIQNSVVAS